MYLDSTHETFSISVHRQLAVIVEAAPFLSGLQVVSLMKKEDIKMAKNQAKPSGSNDDDWCRITDSFLPDWY